MVVVPPGDQRGVFQFAVLLEEGEVARREVRGHVGEEVDPFFLVVPESGELGLLIVGVYSDPRYVIAYDDGEVRQQFNLCFRARPIGGTLRPSSESYEVRWFSTADLAGLETEDPIRLRILHALQEQPTPHLG